MKLDRDVHPQLDPNVNFEINNLGERGSATPKVHRKFLVVGGSAVECFFLDQEICWPAVLENSLNSSLKLRNRIDSPIHVGNIGRSGIDSGTLKITLEKILPTYGKLDSIIIMVGASDVLRWLEIDAPLSRPAEIMHHSELFAQHPENHFGISPNKTALAEVARRIKIRFPVYKENAGRWYKKARAMRISAKELITDVPESKIVTDTYEKNLRDCILLCRIKANKVFVIPQPWFDKENYTEEEKALFWNGGVGKAYKDEISKYYSETVIAQLMRRIYDSTLKVCSKESVTVIDLMGVVEPNVKSFHDQFHFTPSAAKLVGETVASRIHSFMTENDLE